MTTLHCISPIDGSVLATREALSLDAARSAAAQARAAQKNWAARPLQERIDLVMAGVAKIGEQTDRMVTELAQQMATARRVIRREPAGVVLIVAPWNYPYMTAINTLAPALISGSTVILKHATQTMLVGEHLAEAFHDAGVPPDVFQNVFLDHETTSALIGERAFDFVNFTGSVSGGKAMEVAAAGTFTQVATELGGKDPGYVREDADVQAAVDGLIDGAMFNSGQCCCGIERIYVHESLYDAYVEKAVALVKGYRLGHPMDPTTDIGPMAHVRFADLVRRQIAQALNMGATAHIDHMEADDEGAYLTPQILTDVTHEMDVMTEESFGPVVGIMKVRDDEHAIELMNDCKYGLTAAIWTKDAAAAEAIGARLETGTVFMNRQDYLDPALCWTGSRRPVRGWTRSEWIRSPRSNRACPGRHSSLPERWRRSLAERRSGRLRPAAGR